jgi:hypothetical protein
LDPTYSVGGNITGLTGSITLQNGEEELVRSNGDFTFSTMFPDGEPYNVAILSHPTNQECILANASGTITSADITNVTVTCETIYTVGGTLTGLTGSVTLQNRINDDFDENLGLNLNGEFSFVTPLKDGDSYAVTVLNNPDGQKCSVTGDVGVIDAADITNVAVNCTPIVSISATTDGEEPDTDGLFTVSSSLPADANGLTVNYTVDPSSTTTAGADYTALSGSVTIGAGLISAEILVMVLDDTDIEALETLRLNIADNAAYAVGSPSATVNITSADDDPDEPASGLNIILLKAALDAKEP